MSPVPIVTDEQIREMAREAERLNQFLAPPDRKPRGWHFRRAALRLGVVPLCDMTTEEVAWVFCIALERAEG